MHVSYIDHQIQISDHSTVVLLFSTETSVTCTQSDPNNSDALNHIMALFARIWQSVILMLRREGIYISLRMFQRMIYMCSWQIMLYLF